MAMSLAEMRSKREEIQATIMGFEAQLGTIEDPTSDEALKLRGKIASLRDDIAELDKQISKIDAKDQQQEKRDRWRTERPTIDSIIKKNYIGYIIPENKYIYCRDFGRKGVNNVKFNLIPATAIVRTLSKMAGFSIGSRDYNEITDYFEEIGRTYHGVTSSFNTDKWDEGEIYNKMSIVKETWLKPDYKNPVEHPDMGLLINTVCGGKQENIDHLEKWVAFKYLNPSKNANIPNLDMGGNPGGNGKGRMIEVLKTIFGPLCVIQAHKEELEKFNAGWEMAVVLYYDEPEEKELAASKLKQATGSEDMRIEKKGIDATMADRNYNFIFTSNNRQGVVKLSGGTSSGEDRRYSVINTNLVLVDQLVDNGMDYAAAINHVDNIAQKVVKNREIVAQWLAYIIKKHDAEKITNLLALHGEDYKERFETQKDHVTMAFDWLTRQMSKSGFIPQSLFCDLVRTHTENDKHKDSNIIEKFESYCIRNRVEVEYKDRAKYTIMWHSEAIDTKQTKIIKNKNNTDTLFQYDKYVNKKPTGNPVLDTLKKDYLVDLVTNEETESKQ